MHQHFSEDFYCPFLLCCDRIIGTLQSTNAGWQTFLHQHHFQMVGVGQFQICKVRHALTIAIFVSMNSAYMPMNQSLLIILCCDLIIGTLLSRIAEWQTFMMQHL